MTTDEQALQIGNLILQRQTLKRLLVCLQGKAYSLSEHLFVAHQALREQRPYRLDAQQVLIEDEPGQYRALTLPTVAEIHQTLTEIAKAKDDLAAIESRCQDLRLD